MSRVQASKHYARILSQWPVNRLRPELTFQTLLKKRIEAAPVAQVNEANTARAQPPKPRNEAQEVNALYSLLENRYATAYPLSNAMMHPASSPEHYTTLVKELDEVPDRTFFQRIASRWKNMVRMS
ncbi:hypothetical protein E4T50_11575 [Aureobasidium sp. EXF-12298]|nr:hypothetical protein E4T50_11575 [Aureobasidium sp. EXF-12298]KAI4759218.1 hypothetical protein E4T51_07786 [Aureobasidium sp. EXF-12344]KAI4776502.1 hypothetical protein E4T52_08584 [Aureobasidium sp. EXF-3400]